MHRLALKQYPRAGTRFDVVVVGAGLVGCALASRLALAGMRVLVVDQSSNPGEGASKANSAIIHTGFDAEPGSLEAKLVTRASRQWPDFARNLKIPLQPVGALMIATHADQLPYLEKYYAQSMANGVDDVKLLSAKETQKLEPGAYGGQALASLHVPRESIVDPFATCVALAETALATGYVDMLMGCVPVAIEPGIQIRVRSANQSSTGESSADDLVYRADTLVNCAGLGGRRVADLYGGRTFDLNPRRGQFLVYPNHARLLSHIVLPMPSKLGKGVLVSPTIFGQLIAGPTAEDLVDVQEALRTTRDGLASVKSKAEDMLPALRELRPFAQWAGARTNCAQGSYLITQDDGIKGCVTVTGVRSTGLSACFSLADELAERLNVGKPAPTPPRTSYPSWCKRPLSGGGSRPDEGAPGSIVCFCEGATREDIRAAVQSPLNPDTADAVKRYTRATMGRCQGFNCQVPFVEAVAEELGVSLDQVRKSTYARTWLPSNSRVVDDRGPVGTKAPAFLSGAVQAPPWDVVIVGGGPAGIGASRALEQQGRVLLLERRPWLGGVPARYPKDGPGTFLWNGRLITGPKLVSQHLRVGANVTVECNADVTKVERNEDNNGLWRVHVRTLGQVHAKRVVLATGAREGTPTERGLHGARMPWLFSNNLLDLCETRPLDSVVVVGAGVVARGIAAKHFSKFPTSFVGMPDDEMPALARAWFGGGPAVQGIPIDNTGRETMVTAGGLVPVDEVGHNGVAEPNQSVLRVGNCILVNSPAMMCYWHGRYKAASVR